MRSKKVVGVLFVAIFLCPLRANAQDVGTLFKAIAQLEVSLKQLIAHETGQREAQLRSVHGALQALASTTTPEGTSHVANEQFERLTEQVTALSTSQKALEDAHREFKEQLDTRLAEIEQLDTGARIKDSEVQTMLAQLTTLVDELKIYVKRAGRHDALETRTSKIETPGDTSYVTSEQVKGHTSTDARTQARKLTYFGDFRVRSESDWGSRKSDGTERDNRDRLRIRLRFGFNHAYNKYFSLGGRLRTGSARSQQSPHITIGDELEPKPISIDKAFVRAGYGASWFWLGKNSFPFWKQNELFWDDDATLEGAAGGYVFDTDKTTSLKATAGYFILDGSGNSNRFNDKANLLAGQVTVVSGLPWAQLTASVGHFAFHENTEEADPVLEDRDYSIWVLAVKSDIKSLPVPVTIGLDYMKNTRSYASSLFNSKQTSGYVAHLKVGQLKEKGDWLAAYYFAHIEKFAVVARLAQDDWLRWGTATDTRSSNFEGHEIRLAHALGPKLNLVARLYLVEGIQPENDTASAKEDGARFRIDLNIGF